MRLRARWKIRRATTLEMRPLNAHSASRRYLGRAAGRRVVCFRVYATGRFANRARPLCVSRSGHHSIDTFLEYGDVGADTQLEGKFARSLDGERAAGVKFVEPDRFRKA